MAMIRFQDVEAMFGPDAIQGVAKLFARNQGSGSDIARTMIAGVLLTPDNDPIADEESDEMWECEVIIIPRAKFKGKKFRGHTVDQVLREYADRENWDEKIK